MLCHNKLLCETILARLTDLDQYRYYSPGYTLIYQLRHIH